MSKAIVAKSLRKHNTQQLSQWAQQRSERKVRSDVLTTSAFALGLADAIRNEREIGAHKIQVKQRRPRRTMTHVAAASVDAKSFKGPGKQKNTCLVDGFIDPRNLTKVKFDLLIGVIIVYSVVSIPFVIGFEVATEGTSLEVVDIIVDLLFLVDMIVTFRTGYYDGDPEVLVKNQKDVAVKYLQTWFLIDFLSTFPFDRVYQASTDEGDAGDARSIKLIRTVRLVRLTRLMRLFKLSKFAEVVDELNIVSPLTLRFFKLITKIIFIAHLLSCGWYYIATPICSLENEPGYPYICRGLPRPEKGTDDVNWVRYFGVDEFPLLGDRYLASFHMVTASMLAVGYGDISATNTVERLFAVVIQLVGATSYGFILSHVTAIIESGNPREEERRKKRAALKDWMDGRELPRPLRRRIRDHFDHVWRIKAPDEERVLSIMPQDVKQRLLETLHPGWVKVITRTFTGDESPIDASFFTDIIMELHPQQLAGSQIVCQEDELMREVYIIIDGCVEGLRARDRSFVPAQSLASQAIAAHKSDGRRDMSSTAPVRVGGTGETEGPDAAEESRVNHFAGTTGTMGNNMSLTANDASYTAPLDLLDVANKKEEGRKSSTLHRLGTRLVRGRSYKEAPRSVDKTKLSQIQNLTLVAVVMAGEYFECSTLELMCRPSISELTYSTARRTELLCLNKGAFAQAIGSLTGTTAMRDLRKSIDQRAEALKQAVQSPGHLPPRRKYRTPNDEPTSPKSARWKRVTGAVSAAAGGFGIGLRGSQRESEGDTSEPMTVKEAAQELGQQPRRMASTILYKGKASPAADISPDDAAIRQTLDVTTFLGGEQMATARTRKWTSAKEPIEDEETHEDLRERWIASPNDPKKIAWDFFIGALIAFSVIIVPYRIGFGVETVIGDASFVLDCFVDVMFLFDMCASCRAAYVGADRIMETRPEFIVRHYLKTWFIIDFLSTVPIDLIVMLSMPQSEDSSSARALKLIRVGRLVRLLKLARLFKMGKLATAMEEISDNLPTGSLRFAKLCVQLIFLAHWSGCAFFFISTMESDKDGYNVDGKNQCEVGGLECDASQPGMTYWVEEGVSAVNYGEQYVASVYWALTTMTTVGFGDMVPQSHSERVFAVFSMIFGATVFGYVIGSIAAIAGQERGWEAMSKRRLSMVRTFLDDINASSSLLHAAQRSAAYVLVERSPFMDEEEFFLATLPKAIRAETVLYCNITATDAMKIVFTGEPTWFVTTVARMAEPVAVVAGEVCCSNLGPDCDLLITADGECEAITRGSDGVEEIHHVYASGDSFGLQPIVPDADDSQVQEIRACARLLPSDMTCANLLVLKSFTIQGFVEECPELMTRVQRALATSIVHQEKATRKRAEERVEKIQSLEDNPLRGHRRRSGYDTKVDVGAHSAAHPRVRAGRQRVSGQLQSIDEGDPAEASTNNGGQMVLRLNLAEGTDASKLREFLTEDLAQKLTELGVELVQEPGRSSGLVEPTPPLQSRPTSSAAP